MKNKDICNLYEGIVELSKNKDIHFSAKTNYILAKNKVQLEQFYNIIKSCEEGIWRQFGIEREDGSLTIPNDKLREADDEFIKLMDFETDVTVDKINIDEFNDQPVGIELFEKLIMMIKET